jgi:Arylsulfotransferase (ASST)
MKDRFAFLAFLASAMALSTIYGVAAARQDWFPNPQISLALQTVADLRANWKNDLELEPTRHLVAARTPGRPDGFEGFKVHRPEAVSPGYVLIAGLSRNQDRSAFDVVLYGADGAVVHEWPVDYSVLDPEGLRPLNVMLHGMEVFDDGSLAVTFDAGNAIARIDACGQPIWTTMGPFHHSIAKDDSGGLWVWRAEEVVRLDAETGRETHSLGIQGDIIEAGGGQQGIFSIRSYIDGDDRRLRYDLDAFHANDVEPLSAAMADAFPGFRAGDLLISLRELNLVAVIDPEDGRLRWWRHGPWVKQHDPDFQPDGTITVYDNGSGSGVSRILRIDPTDDAVSVDFAGSEEVPFYSWQRGKHQVLPGGNILVTESEHGRVFEVAPDGGLVWERDMGWDADRNLIVTEVRHVAPDFYPDGPPSCAVTASAGDPA